MIITPKISIIVPVYNVEKYIRRCLDSIQRQTFTDWECILVDDGSLDKSGEICDEYAAKDSKFRVFHKENEGVSSARNLGLEKMRGEFVCFFDADDIVPEHSLSYMKSCMTEDVDSVMAGFSFIDARGEKGRDIIPDKSMYLSLEESIAATYGYGYAWQGYLWNRLFKSSIINDLGLRFDCSISYKEDGLFLIQYICNSQRSIFYGNEIVYLYRQHEGSAMGVFQHEFNPKMISNIEAHLRIFEVLNHRGISLELRIISLYNIRCCFENIRKKYRGCDEKGYDKEIEELFLQYLGFLWPIKLHTSKYLRFGLMVKNKLIKTFI